MTEFLLLASAIIIACVVSNRLTHKLGLPTLLAFILLGMFLGSDGVAKIHFDNYHLTQEICTIALIFIMFYGGFGTNWGEAKPIAVKAVLLSSLGTIATAGLVGLFAWGVLKLPLLESFLLGSVISSTDAASVFSILRSRRLSLKDGTASLLEVESGSNDPFSYMLTIIVLSLMSGEAQSGGAFAWQVIAQLAFGLAFGFGIAMASLIFLRRFRFTTAGFDSIFMTAVALLSYAAPTILGGNGYLSVYITGIVLGNYPIGNKRALVDFFDGATSLMQMVLFFLLGLLAFPSQLPAVAMTGLAVALFLTFVARPLAVTLLLKPFGSSWPQIALVSWSGMRGAASIVFSILAVTSPAVIHMDIYHMVFFIVLFSILIQGTLIPFMAQVLGMIDLEGDVMKTFTDYTDEIPIDFLQCTLSPGHPWVGRQVQDLAFPPECLIVLLTRGQEKLVPNGSTVFQEGDTIILGGRAGGESEGVHLYERTIGMRDPWRNRMISTLDTRGNLIIMVRRHGQVIIPKGDTLLQAGDILLINDMDGDPLT